MSVSAKTAYGYIRSDNIAGLYPIALSGNDLFNGSDFDDYIISFAGNDIIYGNDGDDFLDGGAGNDTLSGGAGNDTLAGGAGNDIYLITDAGDSISEFTSGGTDVVQTALVSYTLGANLESLVYTGSSNFSGTGNGAANSITGGTGNDSLVGAAGNDTLNGGAGNDTLDGGVGTDSLIGGAGDDLYIVDVTADVVNETVAGSGGIDTVQSSVTYTLGTNLEHLVLSGSGVINGTGNALNNRLTGNAAANALSGAAGNDTLLGGGGNDTLTGGAGADSQDGGAGSDIYVVAATADLTGDVIADSGVSGTDELRFTATSAGTLTLASTLSGVEQVVVGTGTAAATVATGTTAINVNAASVGYGISLIGNAGANILTGGNFNDSLVGNAGNDTLSGGGGNDTLTGGAGNDNLTGGAGNDLFVFNVATGSTNIDTITDFATGVDKIQLSKTIFAGIGTLDGTDFVSGAGVTKAATTSQHIIYNTTTGALYYDADGTGSAPAVQIALIGTTTHPSLAASDFVMA